MFDQRPAVSSDLHGHPQAASSRPLHAAAVTKLEAEAGTDPLVSSLSGCGLLDGIRSGIISHGWTLPGLAHRTELPMPMLRSIMDWKPGLPAADAVWWSLELEAMAATHGCRICWKSGRSSASHMVQIARSLLRQTRGTWAEFTQKANAPNTAGPQLAGSGGWGGEDPLEILDRMAIAGGVAPVLRLA